MSEPDSVEHVRQWVDELVGFAYEQGFHELGFNPVDALIAAAEAKGRADERERIERLVEHLCAADVSWHSEELVSAIRAMGEGQ